MRTKLFLVMVALIMHGAYSQNSELQHVEPPFWWTGMVNPDLQIMLHGEDIADFTPELDYQGVSIKNVEKPENSNYLIVNLSIADNTKPGSFDLTLKDGKKKVISYSYELKERDQNATYTNSFNPSDVLYLITPDRFANGNPENDSVDGLLENVNRSNPGGRHGGDIQGISDQLDYIKDLGFTAIWVNPMLENDMKEYSYHGYSTTDFYSIDSRFGSNEEYKELVSKANENGIKVIMDMILNHCGSNHWWMKDLPSSNWFNYQKEYIEEGKYQNTSHRKTVIQDPYVSQIDVKEFTDGWFVPSMPDMNQRNPHLATYLIQNSIWWIEYTGINGIRMDTYPYPEKDFMTDWTCAVKNEYPDFITVGEEWYQDPSIVSFWQQGKNNINGYTSCLPSLMDFPLQAKLSEGLNQPEGGFSGWSTTYTTLALDFMYPDPSNLVVFPDNHDMSRFFTQVNEDFNLFKLGMTYILTVRGIPQIYYGSEILMKNPGTGDHGIIRSDFPGGWEGDEVNAFSGEGLTEQQKEAKDFFRKLLNWRKSETTVHDGKLMHYNPKDGIYVLFRYTDDDKVMVVLSKNSNEITLDLSRFSEMIMGDETGFEVLTGNEINFKGSLTVPPMTPMVIDLNN
ncbi:MAG: glycoside hydrolase family 13 protein [Cyclobacteriaceae bacterium]